MEKKKTAKKPSASKIKNEEEKEVCEIFELEDKKGNTKTKEVCGMEPQEHANQEEIKKQNRILKSVLITIGIIIFAVIVWTAVSYYTNNFQYKGINFNIVKANKIKFYHTLFPITKEGMRISYNVYLRNDPRKLEKEVPFNGEMILREMLVVNSTKDFICDGDGSISMLNLQQIFAGIGTSVIKDPESGCDPDGRYLFLKIQEGNETSIEQTSPACYELNVAECNILKATERYIVEAMVKLKEQGYIFE
ncbi:MAG TPA: hypothetical protein VJH65_01240 [Candidatus Nanoarchaeia archaeon]|nr:hypothetical protein [Candidatus Nanoarchaeia archaeon]